MIFMDVEQFIRGQELNQEPGGNISQLWPNKKGLRPQRVAMSPLLICDSSLKSVGNSPKIHYRPKS